MQHSKQRDSLSGTLLLVHRWRRPDGFGWRRILWRKLRNRSAVNRQELPQASIFLPETNISLLCRLEWKRFRTLLVPRSPLRATCQHFLEILLYARKHRGDISWEPAFFRQGLKRDLPIRWRRNQTPGKSCVPLLLNVRRKASRISSVYPGLLI